MRPIGQIKRSFYEDGVFVANVKTLICLGLKYITLDFYMSYYVFILCSVFHILRLHQNMSPM